MPDEVIATTICRFCHASCPLEVTLRDGVAVKARGNPRSPGYWGFCCTRGQALPEAISRPDRLYHSQKRMPDGSYQPIEVGQAMDEIAERLSAIISGSGASSVAFYIGSAAGMAAATGPVAGAFLAALGTPMLFTSMTIDQPGKAIANAALGRWLAGPQPFAGSDVHLLIGANPLVAIGSGGVPFLNPARRLKQEIDRGMKLIVIDPRRTETARRAHIHLQARPGEDAALLAAMIHVILRDGLVDNEFVHSNVTGLHRLAAAVGPFTPEMAGARADVPAQHIEEAARCFAQAKRGCAAGSTGANMSGNASLNEYLISVLNTICGRWLRAGECVPNPGVLMPAALPKAQAQAPGPLQYPDFRLRGRDIPISPAGLPTSALADEILLEGEGRIRALFSMGNPVAGWPDQRRTAQAMNSLDLLVQIDICMSATAQMADYVIAPKMSIEVPAITTVLEQMEFMGSTFAVPEPYSMYSPKLVDPPQGSELIEEWEFFYGLAQRLGLNLVLYGAPGQYGPPRKPTGDPVSIDMHDKPTTDDLYALFCRDGRVPYERVKQHRDGAVFPLDIPAAPKDADCDARLDVGNAQLLAELEALPGRQAGGPAGDAYQFRLISRRMPSMYNSSGRDIESLRRKRGGAYNPAFMHPDDIEALGLADEEEITIASERGKISGIVKADADLRRGLVSMAHAFGEAPGQGKPDEPRKHGSNTGVLCDIDDVAADPITAIPRMSAIPVSVQPARRS